jgi:hypothetical protein
VTILSKMMMFASEQSQAVDVLSRRGDDLRQQHSTNACRSNAHDPMYVVGPYA